MRKHPDNDQSTPEKEWKIFFEKIKQITDDYRGQNDLKIFTNIEIAFSKRISCKLLQKYAHDYREFQNTPKNESAGIGKVKISELIIYLNNKYPKIETESLMFSIDSDSLVYIYYYEGSQKKIKRGLIIFKHNSTEWVGGELYHFKDNDPNMTVSSKFSLVRIKPKKPPKITNDFLYFMASCDHEDYKNQIHFYTFNIKGHSINKRYLTFLTSSAISTNNTLGKVPSINFGIIKQVHINYIQTEFNTEIDSWIKTALSRKKLTFDKLENSIFNSQHKYEIEKETFSETTINISNYCCHIFADNYLGYYFRNDIPSNSTDEVGGIAVVILKAEIDGKASIYISHDDKCENDKYKGHVQFPYNDYKYIKGNFVLKENNAYRFSLYINEIGDRDKFGGVLSSFNEHGPFSSPIIFYRIKESDLQGKDFSAILSYYKPQKINRYDFENYITSISEKNPKLVIKKILRDLKAVNKLCMPDFKLCLPKLIPIKY